MAELVTRTDVEAQGGGLSYEDFKQAGVQMTKTQFDILLENLIKAATSATLGYCGRNSWVKTSYTEYHDGRGQNSEKDLLYMLREIPVKSVTSIHVDTSDFTAAVNWEERTVRSASVAGDYTVLQRPSYVIIRFHNNVPPARAGNVKIVYQAGYETTDREYNDIKEIIITMVCNYLDLIKRRQIGYAVANPLITTQDASTIIPITDKRTFTDTIKERLRPYKRTTTWGRGYR